MIKNCLIFIVGAALGALSSCLYFKKKYEQKADEEIEDMRKWYDKQLKEHGIDIHKDEESSEPASAPESYSTDAVPNASESSFIRGEKHVKHETIDYTKYYRAAESEHPTEDYSEDPEIISREDFGRDGRFSKVTLLYYSVDGNLTLSEDQTEELINEFDEVQSMVGDTLAKSGFADEEDQEVLYLINRGRSCYYEIRKIYGRYKE